MLPTFYQTILEKYLSNTQLIVATCNANRSDLQSGHFSARIKCNYNCASARIICNWARIKCNWTCNHRFEPELFATIKVKKTTIIRSEVHSPNLSTWIGREKRVYRFEPLIPLLLARGLRQKGGHPKRIDGIVLTFTCPLVPISMKKFPLDTAQIWYQQLICRGYRSQCRQLSSRHQRKTPSSRPQQLHNRDGIGKSHSQYRRRTSFFGVKDKGSGVKGKDLWLEGWSHE